MVRVVPSMVGVVPSMVGVVPSVVRVVPSMVGVVPSMVGLTKEGGSHRINDIEMLKGGRSHRERRRSLDHVQATTALEVVFKEVGCPASAVFTDALASIG